VRRFAEVAPLADDPALGIRHESTHGHVTGIPSIRGEGERAHHQGVVPLGCRNRHGLQRRPPSRPAPVP
jgi:hypothetical protein